jgi:hypothetical protein
VHRDLEYLRKQAKENLKSHIRDRLQEEYQKCMIGINQVLKISWDIVHNDSTNNNNRLQALALINDCNKYKMDLTTNDVVITDAIKFVQSSKEKLNGSRELENGKDTRPEEKEQQGEKETDNEETMSTTSIIKINQVF